MASYSSSLSSSFLVFFVVSSFYLVLIVCVDSSGWTNHPAMWNWAFLIKEKEPLLPSRAFDRLKAKPSTLVVKKVVLPIVSPGVKDSVERVSDTTSKVNISLRIATDESPSATVGFQIVPSPGDSSKIIVSVPPILIDSMAQAASVDLVPLLGTLLPEGNVSLLSEFSIRQARFLLFEGNYPATFLRPTYAFFADFLHFMCSHLAADLLGTF
ncbi:hypothetical protein SESBI_26675 [Sesbania bispinosa]|nr:hypothetical protein SESBI_26675 [Sesbania bispinosa]